MEHDFWHQRWAEGRIGFHLSEVNELLQSYWAKLVLGEDARVFVPLCGKSLDLIWLREQGHKVLGIELNEGACEAFFSENLIKPEKESLYDYSVWFADNITLLCGNFFSLKPDMLVGVSAVYDRAALVALPPEMRRQYAHLMCLSLPLGVKILLVTLEFDGDQGPPFSVSETELHQLYSQRFSIDKLGERVDADRKEVCWLLTDSCRSKD